MCKFLTVDGKFSFLPFFFQFLSKIYLAFLIRLYLPDSDLAFFHLACHHYISHLALYIHLVLGDYDLLILLLSHCWKDPQQFLPYQLLYSCHLQLLKYRIHQTHFFLQHEQIQFQFCHLTLLQMRTQKLFLKILDLLLLLH